MVMPALSLREGEEEGARHLLPRPVVSRCEVQILVSGILGKDRHHVQSSINHQSTNQKTGRSTCSWELSPTSIALLLHVLWSL